MSDDKDKEIQRLHAYRDAVHEMASFRYEQIDDYIMIAKQAVQDYEQGNKHGYAGKKRLAQSRFNPNKYVIKDDDGVGNETVVEIIGNSVFIDQGPSEMVSLSVGQAKQLTNFLHDRIVRPVRFDFDWDDHYE